MSIFSRSLVNSVASKIKTVKAKKFVYINQFNGDPKASDMEIQEEELPPVRDGEFLAEAVYLSVDPYMRLYANTGQYKLGETFVGTQIAKITESKNPKFPVEKYIVAPFGWRTHTISNGVKGPEKPLPPTILPDLGGLPLSLGLGILGLPGNAAYFGLFEVLKPQKGQTLVVSGAAGAVGSVAGQIAKHVGLTVVGIAGSNDKGKWLTEELGFDHFINYKTQDVDEALQKAAPKGVDIYFDNVGGEISSSVIHQLNLGGITAVCGSISNYNDKNAKARIIQSAMVAKRLTLRGFGTYGFTDRWNEGIEYNLDLIKKGKLKYHETVTEGFENMFKAFVGMMKGDNIGKAVVKV